MQIVFLSPSGEKLYDYRIKVIGFIGQFLLLGVFVGNLWKRVVDVMMNFYKMSLDSFEF